MLVPEMSSFVRQFYNCQKQNIKNILDSLYITITTITSWKATFFIKLLHFEAICIQSSKIFKYVYSLNYFVINFFALSHMQIWWSRNCITYLKACIISSGNSSAKCNFMEELFVKLTFSRFSDLLISFIRVQNMEIIFKIVFDWT